MLVMDPLYLPMQLGHLNANTLNMSNIWSKFITDMAPSLVWALLSPWRKVA
jgi:hypothetical protein